MKMLAGLTPSGGAEEDLPALELPAIRGLPRLVNTSPQSLNCLHMLFSVSPLLSESSPPLIRHLSLHLSFIQIIQDKLILRSLT